MRFFEGFKSSWTRKGKCFLKGAFKMLMKVFLIKKYFYALLLFVAVSDLWNNKFSCHLDVNWHIVLFYDRKLVLIIHKTNDQSS